LVPLRRELLIPWGRIKDALPLLINVTVWAGVVWPAGSDPKLIADGVNEATPPFTPVPLTDRVSVLTLVVIVNLALSRARTVGLKVTESMQGFPGLIALQELPLIAKSAVFGPDGVIAFTVNVLLLVPILLSVTDWGGLVSLRPSWLKATLVAESFPNGTGINRLNTVPSWETPPVFVVPYSIPFFA
jgi:hypothetical protein